jgi:hypothetical protein
MRRVLKQNGEFHLHCFHEQSQGAAEQSVLLVMRQF